jgi:AbiV family abortive infection protein
MTKTTNILVTNLSEYRGPLDAAAIAEGINAASRNACRLVDDAKLLLDAERYPSAAALAALAIEERGKVSILRALAVAQSPEELRAQWRRYRDHRSKNGAWILPSLAAQGAHRLDHLGEAVERDAEHTAVLNSLKQIGLYTDCYGSNARWSEPKETIDGSLACALVNIAELLSKEKIVTPREIELWVEHLSPVWNTSEMPHALLRWATAMHREGLSDTIPEEFARFVLGDIASADWKSEACKAQ